MTRTDTVFHIADDYVETFMRLSPIAASELGLTTRIDGLGDLSPAGHDQRRALCVGTRDQLDRVRPASDPERIASAYMSASLSSAVELHGAGESLRDLNCLRTLRQTFDGLRTDRSEDRQALLDLLGEVPGALAGVTDSLRMGVELGVVASRRQVRRSIEVTRSWSDRHPDGFFPRLVAGVSADLEAPANAAADAYGAVAGFLEDEYLSVARDEDGSGAEIYELWARSHLGGDIDLGEACAWAWNEVQRIGEQIRRACDQIEAGADLRRAREVLQTLDGGWIEGAESYRAWLQELADSTVEQLDGVHFDIAAPVRRLEVMISPPGTSTVAYYQPPSEDFTRLGRTWYPIHGQARFRPLSGISTAYHEGVPGHHLQNGAVRMNAETLSRYQRAFYLNFHGEGWALYAEELMGELGYLDTPEAQLSMLAGQQVRAARVILDIGINCHLTIPTDQPFHPAETWTAELASEYLQHLGWSQPVAQSEVYRYLGSPAQAITYKLGQQAWQAARLQAQRQLGPQFDLKDFHTAALRLGPLGVEDLAPEILRALDQQTGNR